MAAAKKSSSGMAGGVLVFLGALVYLYVIFTWYSGSATAGLPAWITASSFLGPLVIVVAIVSAISLFFMSIGTMAGKMMSGGADAAKHMMMTLWKFVMLGGITTLILTGWTAWFWWAIVGFILTYLGAMMASM